MPEESRKPFIEQLRERHIWRVLVAYPSVTFVLLQAIEFFINNYDLDARTLTAGIIVAVVLLPAAFIWNWRHGEAGEQPFSRSEIGMYAISVMAAVIATGWYWRATPPAGPAPKGPASSILSVAVLPFENAGGEDTAQYLCDGIAESLINWLATLADVRVVSKSAAFRMRDRADDTAAVANTLGVDHILRGQLELLGDQVVVSASLVDTRDDTQLWGERLTQPSAEVLGLEQSIVEALRASLSLEVSGASASEAVPGGTSHPEAYERYLRGHFLIQSTNPESIVQGIDELRAAIRADPAYARPYADIADALAQMISYGHLHGDELLGEARNAAYTAVALAPELAEAHTALATVLQYFEFDWPAVDAAYEAAVGLQPQSPVPYHRYTDYLVWTLRFNRAREMARAAVGVDPLDSSAMHAVGLVELFAGNFSAASEAFGEWNQYHPGSRWSYVKHALALALEGQCDTALAQADTVLDMSGGQVSTLMESWLAWGYRVCDNPMRYARSKERIEADFARNAQRWDPGYTYLAALEGNGDLIIEELSVMVAERHPLAVFAQIFLIDYFGWGISDTLPHDERYLTLIEQLDFPPRD